MSFTPLNRMAQPETRGRGRPRNDEVRQPEIEAPPIHVDGAVLPCTCPKCGRGMTPRILHRRADGSRDCACGLCGAGFVYTPATVRVKNP